MLVLTKADRDAMYLAKSFLNKYDADMAAYVLRDTHLARELDFTGLLWAIYRGGTCVKEMEYVFEEIVEALDKRR